MEDKNILRHIFLREFTRQLVAHSSKEEILNSEQIQIQIKKPKIEDNNNALEKMMMHKVSSLPKIQTRKIETLPPSKRQISNQNNSMNNLQPSIMTREAPKIETPKINIPRQPIQNNLQGLDLGKVRNILSDPRIQTIECQGPDKPILVKKDGNIMSTKMILTKEEVAQIIQNFSRESKVPLIGGTFKAMVGNLIMTAVESEFVGSRFIIQKRNPFEKDELFSSSGLSYK